MSSINKNILAIGGLVVLVAVGYYLFVLQKSSPDALLDGSVISQADTTNQDFLRRLSDLESLTVPTEILDDQRLRSLVDSATPRREVSVGREDPFSPIN